MEPSQFDEFTKAMATPTSRRQAIKTFVASTFGGIFALSGLGRAFASGCHPACSGGKTCCGGKCVDTKTDPHNCGVCGTVCKSGLCVNGLCCPVGAVKCGNSCCSFTCCNGTCINTCKGLQQACTSSCQCCNTQGKTICAEDLGRGVVCCNLPGGSCSNDFDCCADEVCSGGKCQCDPSGDFCTKNAECCSGVCLSNNTCM